jgi:hypothetical protein
MNAKSTNKKRQDPLSLRILFLTLNQNQKPGKKVDVKYGYIFATWLFSYLSTLAIMQVPWPRNNDHSLFVIYTWRQVGEWRNFIVHVVQTLPVTRILMGLQCAPI